MCNVAAAGLAISAIGTAYSVHASETARKQAQANAQAQAQVARMAATYEKGAADVEAQTQRIETDKLKARQRVLFAKSGVDIGAGSPLDVMSDTEMLGRLAEKQIRTAADYRAWGLETQATDALMVGEQRATRARQESVGSLLSGLGSGYEYATSSGMLSTDAKTGKTKWNWKGS